LFCYSVVLLILPGWFGAQESPNRVECLSVTAIWDALLYYDNYSNGKTLFHQQNKSASTILCQNT
jgi:hypothetical protein